MFPEGAMGQQNISAGRAITDYFNSSAWHASQESELLAAIMTELMRSGSPLTNKVLIAHLIERLEHEADEVILQSYRNVLTQLMAETPQADA